MGEPAYQLPDEDKPDIRPHLRALEGGGETTPRTQGHLSSVNSDQAASPSPQQRVPGTTQGEPKDLTSSSSRIKKAKAVLWGTKLRRNSTIGGGILGLLLGSLGIGSLWFAGPLEVVHIAQFLTKSHFQEQSDQGDERMGKLYRFVRSGGDVGETRLGFIGSHYKTTMISDMEKIGLKPVYGSTTTMQGLEIDTTKDGPYKGMTEDEVKARLTSKGFSADGMTFKDGKAEFSAKGFFGKNGGRAANKALVKELGYGKISGALRVRILNKYGMVTWHPLKKLDAKLNQKIVDSYAAWKKERDERLRTGIGEAGVQGTTSTEETDRDGKTTQSPTGDPSVADATIKDPSKSASVLKSISEHKGASIAGGLAAVQGVVCGLRELGTGIDDVRYSQVVMPLMRMGWDAVTIGNQIMAGQDVDAQTVKFVSKSFTTTDPKTHQTSNWNQAASIQALEGNEGSGTPAPEAFKNIKGGVPDWLQWTQNGIVAGACSGGAQLAGGVVSVGLGIISGDIINQLGGLVVSMVAVPRVMAAATGFLAGQAVDVSAAGADYGSAIDYGSRLNANAAAMQFGGAPLSEPEVAQLNSERDAADQQEFATKSFAYRIFNPHDNRTLAAKLIDNSDAIQPQNVASTIGSMFTNIGSVLRIPASLLTAKTHAAATYDYGFPQFGFSQADMDNSLVNDPYANADAVAKILDGPDGQGDTEHAADNDPHGYIDRAEKCFGIQISYDEDGWQAVTDTSAGDGKGINPYATTGDAAYNDDNCRDKGNNDWLRVRFFIFDMGEMEGWACYQGDETSCEHDGVIGATSQATGGGDTSADTFTVATYNLAHELHNAGGCKLNECAVQRSQRQANMIAGKDGNPAFDIVATQETSIPQQQRLLQDLPGYASFPAEVPKSQGRAVFWDTSKFKKIDSGYVKAYNNVDEFANDNPWVELQTAAGKKVFMLSIHSPNNANGGSDSHRAANAVIFRDWASSKEDGSAIVLVGGDFNKSGRIPGGGYCTITTGGILQHTHDLQMGKSKDVACPSTSASVIPLDQVYVSPIGGLTASGWKWLGSNNSLASLQGTDHGPMYVTLATPAADKNSSDTAATTGRDFVGRDGFIAGSCVDYVKYILARHSSKYHWGTLGDGKDVARNLGGYGYAVNHTPAIHATVSFPTTLADATYGHVALVAAINKDGSIVVEESNWTNANHYGTHTVKASEVGKLTYAHTEAGWH